MQRRKLVRLLQEERQMLRPQACRCHSYSIWPCKGRQHGAGWIIHARRTPHRGVQLLTLHNFALQWRAICSSHSVASSRMPVTPEHHSYAPTFHCSRRLLKLSRRPSDKVLSKSKLYHWNRAISGNFAGLPTSGFI